MPCLDVEKGREAKGVKFESIRDAGDQLEIARRYNEQGADEITFLDITATHEGRDTTLHTVERMASEVFIPLTVGGGVRTVQDIRNLLNAGADKVSINSAAVFTPEFVGEAADRFGSQCIVVAIDAKRVFAPGEPARWEIFTHGGRKPTGLDAVEWAKKMEALGAGEILLTSMDQDGVKSGYDLGVTRAIDRKSTRLNSSHVRISYAVFCLKKKTNLLAIAGSSRGDHRRRAYEQPLPVHFHVGGEVRLVHEEELGTARLRRAPQRPVRRVNC